MKILLSLLKSLLFIFLILLLASPLWFKLLPNHLLSSLTGKSALTDKYLCSYPLHLSGQSMNPLIAPGTDITLNRCFNQTDLTTGTIVLFNQGQTPHFGIIRHILPLEPIVYKISDEKAPQLLHDCIYKDIIAITNQINTSDSVYRSEKDIQSFIIDSKEFVSDLYLAKIPKGTGIEMSTPQKTTTFSIAEDKFCSVVYPKQKLSNVDIQIIDKQTQQIITQSSGLVFDLNLIPNINCDDFGDGKYNLNLKPGSYQWRFYLNHQVLADIHFDVI